MDKLNGCPVCKNTHFLFLNNCFRCGARLTTEESLFNIFKKYPLSIIALSLVLLSLLWNPLIESVEIFLIFFLFVKVDLLNYFIKVSKPKYVNTAISFSTPLRLKIVFALIPLLFILMQYAEYEETKIWVEFLELRKLDPSLKYEIPYFIELFLNDSNFISIVITSIMVISYVEFFHWLNTKIFVDFSGEQRVLRLLNYTSLKENYTNLFTNLKRFINKISYTLLWCILSAFPFLGMIFVLSIVGYILGLIIYPFKSYLSGTSYLTGIPNDFLLSFLIVLFEVMWNKHITKREKTIELLAETVSKRDNKNLQNIAKITLYYLGKFISLTFLIVWITFFDYRKCFESCTSMQILAIIVLILPIAIFIFNFNYCLDKIFKNQSIVKNAEFFSLISVFFIFFIFMGTGFNKIRVGYITLSDIIVIIQFLVSITIVDNFLYNSMVKNEKKFSSYDVKILGVKIDHEHFIWLSDIVFIIFFFKYIYPFDIVSIIILNLSAIFLIQFINGIYTITEAKDSTTFHAESVCFFKLLFAACVIAQLYFIYLIFTKHYYNSLGMYKTIILIFTAFEILLIVSIIKNNKYIFASKNKSGT